MPLYPEYPMKPRRKDNQTALPKLFEGEPWPDTVSAWAEAYFRLEVTTSPRSRKEQQRDLQLFLDFLVNQSGDDNRLHWTPRLSRTFIDWLRNERLDDKRRWSDRTINRMAAHLKTFTKWIHKHQPFPLGNPMEKIKALQGQGGLEIDRALTEDERRKLLDAADYLPIIGGRSRDKRRAKQTLPNERPRRKGYRPWRNRAIIYTLIETGMRRGEVTSIDLADVDFDNHCVIIIEKGGQRRRCQVSQAGMHAIRDYIEKERCSDARGGQAPSLFLPARTVANSRGCLAPTNINTFWNEVCQLAGIKGKTPHSARHGMGLHIVKKTGNPRAAQRQLGHKNPSTTMQYLDFTQSELQKVLDGRT